MTKLSALKRLYELAQWDYCLYVYPHMQQRLSCDDAIAETLAAFPDVDKTEKMYSGRKDGFPETQWEQISRRVRYYIGQFPQREHFALYIPEHCLDKRKN